MRPIGGVEVLLYPFLTTALEGGEESLSRPSRSLTPGTTRYPLYGRLGGSQGRSGKVRKISPQLVFDPWTVQPEASRYTDYAIWPTMYMDHSVKVRVNQEVTRSMKSARGNKEGAVC